MKRFFLTLAAAAALAVAQEHGAAPAPAKDGRHLINPGASREINTDTEPQDEDPLLKWKWINFAILVGVLGYLIGKQAPPFFKSRNDALRRDLADSRRMREDAERRASEMERRLATLGAEIDRMRTEASEQMAKEGDRIRRDTEQQIARVQHGAEQEIDSIAKHATAALKAEAADLAVRLAEQRIRAEMGPQTQASLVDRFVSDLDAKGARS